MSVFKDKILLITGGTGSFGNAVLRRFLDSSGLLVERDGEFVHLFCAGWLDRDLEENNSKGLWADSSSKCYNLGLNVWTLLL